MSAVFQTLGELSTHLAGTNIEVVDPGVPLVEWAAELSNDPSWKNQPSIRKVVGFAARNIASVPMHLYEFVGEQDRRRVRDGALAEVLRRPSRAPGETAYRFWERVLIEGLIYDRFAVRIVERDDGYELVRIPARLVTFAADALDRITSVNVRKPDGTVQELDPAGFILDAGYATKGASGTSPLKTLRDLLDEQTEAVRYRRSIWRNGARTAGVIERPANTPWAEGARERFGRSWGNFSRGGGQEGGTPVLEDGMQYKPVDAFRPKDTMDLEGRQLTDAEVAAAFHIAPELVGAREGTFSNIKAFKEMLYGPALGPYISAWEQTLDATLIPLLGTPNQYVEANVEAKMRGSFEEQAGVLSTSVGAPWMTRNEARAKQNMSAIDGGDELITPLNVLVGGQASPQDGKTGLVLAKFAARQEQVVRSQKAAGADWWDGPRWDRELVADLVKAGVDVIEAATVAKQFNTEAEQRFRAEEES